MSHFGLSDFLEQLISQTPFYPYFYLDYKTALINILHILNYPITLNIGSHCIPYTYLYKTIVLLMLSIPYLLAFYVNNF
jgi:hypothetical protein